VNGSELVDKEGVLAQKGIPIEVTCMCIVHCEV
jgi:hypothetical protein